MNRNLQNESDHTVLLTRKAVVQNSPARREPFLLQITGSETGRMFNLAGRAVNIGRATECHIACDDPHLSRVHAEIVCRENGEVWVRDLGSKNGVFVNAEQVGERLLRDGDKIRIGDALIFKFCYQDEVEKVSIENLFRAANMDALTQLYNKRYFFDILAREFNAHRRLEQPLSLLMMDVDHFKKINDQHGHLAGDQVLKTMGQHLQKHLRGEDVSCRYGGEEFAILLRNTPGEPARGVAERIRREIEDARVVWSETTIRHTISIGIALLSDAEFQTAEEFLHAADQNLYRAKTGGRNRVVGAEPGTGR